jgi:hypothetical protein
MGKHALKSNSDKLDPTRLANLPKNHDPTRPAINSGAAYECITKENIFFASMNHRA